MTGTLRLLAATALCAAVGACAGVTGPAGSEVVDARYSVSGGSFAGSGALIVMLRAAERDGRIVICGARTKTRLAAPDLPYEKTVLGTGVVQLAGRNLFQGLERFPEHPLAEDMTGSAARCFATATPWAADFEGARPMASFVRLQFGDEEDGTESVFRETPLPDVIAR